MEKDPSFQFGTSTFTFPNGDKYEGEYWAHSSGLIWRHGHGTYTTHDGQIYEGQWKDDKLDDSKNVQITYTNQDQFLGRVSKYKYNGPGCYAFNTENYLVSEFAGNKPKGEVALVDYKGNCWYGTAGNDKAILFQEHVFHTDLDYERGKGVPKHSQETLEGSEDLETSVEKKPSLTMSELERKVFAKSEKTLNDIDFKNSEWYADYKRKRSMLKVISEKLTAYETSSLQKNKNSLSIEERELYARLLKSQDIVNNRANPKETDILPIMLNIYFSAKFQESCPPVKVMYPSEDECYCNICD